MARLNKFVINKDSSEVFGYSRKADAEAAQRESEGSTLVLISEDLQGLSKAQLVAIHNEAVDAEAQVKDFKNKAEAIETVYPLLSGYAKPGEIPERPERAPREQSLDGIITILEKGREAKRQEGSRRTASWKILEEHASKKGTLSVKDYSEAGGNLDDLKIMRQLEHVTVE
ncbi:MAG: hypothetical protein WDA12_04850 [Bacilli bacterium]